MFAHYQITVDLFAILLWYEKEETNYSPFIVYIIFLQCFKRIIPSLSRSGININYIHVHNYVLQFSVTKYIKKGKLLHVYDYLAIKANSLKERGFHPLKHLRNIFCIFFVYIISNYVPDYFLTYIDMYLKLIIRWNECVEIYWILNCFKNDAVFNVP